MTTKTLWSKPFDPEKKLFDYFGEDVKYKSLIDDLYISPFDRNSDKHKNRYKILTLNAIYKEFKYIILGYSGIHPEKRIANVSELEDYHYEMDLELDELTETSGWTGDFYNELNHKIYYTLLMLLTDKGYDVRPQWREFKDDMTTAWVGLPHFYKCLGSKSRYYIEPPYDYDENKPFPQYQLLSTFDGITNKSLEKINTFKPQTFHWKKPFDRKKKLVEYLGEDKTLKSIIKEVDERILNHKWQYWVKDPEIDMNFIGLYAHMQVVIGDIENFAKQMRSHKYRPYIEWEDDIRKGYISGWLKEKSEVLKWDLNFYKTDIYKPFYRLLQHLTENGYDVRSEWQVFKYDIEKLWETLPEFYRGLGTDSPYYVKTPTNYFPLNPFILPSDLPDLDNSNLPSSIIYQKYTWSKKYDFFNPLNNDEAIVKGLSFVNHILFDIKYDLIEMSKSGYDRNAPWEDTHERTPEDWLKVQVEDSGLPTNFYDNDVYLAYYQNLKKLSEEGYDLRIFWKGFRNKMWELWKLLPNFYNGLSDNTSYYVKPPADYDKNKPFPQYPIPEDID